jgi:hypothetical protein
MTEADFIDITIIGNHTAKPPRKDGKNKEGQAQFIITFSLSRDARPPWIEAFNRIWGERSKQIPSLPLPIVSDDRIQISCPIDNRLQGHLDDLKQEVAATNQAYRAYLRAAEDERRSQEEFLQRLLF